MELIEEPPMARDFFRSTPRDASPSYRWARRSKSRSAAPDKEQDARSFQDINEKGSPFQRRSGAPAPLTLPSLRSKSLVVDATAPRTAAIDLGSSSLKLTPVRKVGLTADGANSPTGPLEFPASPASSSGSFKDTASPVPKLGPMRSMRLSSPNRGPRQGSLLSPASPDATRRSAGAIRSGAQSGSPLSVQKQAEAPAMQTPPGAAGKTREVVNVAKNGGPSARPGGSGQSGVKAAPRHSTPFRRGLDAIKGRLFSDSRKSSEAAAAEDIRKTQQTLAAGHKVKPAASSGIKSMLVSRLTRLGRSSRTMAPPPLAIQEAPSAPAPDSPDPAPALLVSPRHLALHSPMGEEHMQPDEVEPEQGLRCESMPAVDAVSECQKDEQEVEGLEQEAESSSSSDTMVAVGQGPHTHVGQEQAGEKEAWRVEENGESRAEKSLGHAASSWVDTPVAVEGGGDCSHGSAGEVGESKFQKNDTESDSDQESPIPSTLSRLSFNEVPSPSPRRTSWAQRVPLAASPAASWDSQSSLEFANSHRPSVAQRFLSSESSSSEQGSPLYLERARASPLGVTSAMTSGSLAAGEDDQADIESAPPVAPSSPAPAPLYPRVDAGLASRRLHSSLLWSSDEEEEEKETEEERRCRKRDMAAALHQLREFQAGGSTPRQRITAPLQRSLTDPSAAVTVRRTASPMRTLWQQGSGAASGEGVTSSAARMGMAAAGRALSSRSLSRTRDRSPCHSGLLASPRPLHAEPSPLRTRSGAFDDGPRSAEVRLGRSNSMSAKSSTAGGMPGRFAKTPGRSRPIAAAAAFFRSMTPGRQRAQVM